MKNSNLNFALDFGGTNTKFSVVRDNVEIFSDVRQGVTPSWGQKGEAEIKPDLFVSHVEDLKLEMIHRFGFPAKVAITGQMASYALVDDQFKFLSPIISWQDSRVSHLHAEDSLYFDNQLVRFKALGIVPNDGFREGLPLLSLPCVIRDLNLNLVDVNFISLLGLANKIWAGYSSFEELELHVTDAHASGFYSLTKNDWDQDALSAVGIKNIGLPKVSNFVNVNLSSGKQSIEVLTSIGDQQAAVVGNSLKPRELFMHMATGGQVAQIVDTRWKSKPFDLENSPVQYRPMFNQDHFLATITHLPAGRLLSKAVQMQEVLNGNESPKFDLMLNSIISVKNRKAGDPIFYYLYENPGHFNIQNLTFNNFSFEKLLEVALFGTISTFCDSVKKLPSCDFESAVLSGGVLNKQLVISNFIKSYFPDLIFRQAVDHDASLLGLRLLFFNEA